MTLMAEAYGEDTQLVAFMQYTRVILVTAIASLIAKFWVGGVPHLARTVAWLPAIAWLPLLKTLALALSGPLLARWLRIRAGALLIPLILGAILVHRGWMTIELPRWLLLIAYLIIGWRIGLRFTRPLLARAMKALPQVLGSTFALIAICMGLSALLMFFGGVDPLTAYLAMSPGGADTVAIIAASSNVDSTFVMSMQMLRFLVVLFLGPPLAQFFAARGADTPATKLPSELPINEAAQ